MVDSNYSCLQFSLCSLSPLFLPTLSLLSSFFFFFNDTATTEIYTLSLHDALPISCWPTSESQVTATLSSVTLTTSARSEEHTSELQSRFELVCRLLLEKKKKQSHPFNTLRAAELDRWIEMDHYERILSGDYPSRGHQAEQRPIDKDIDEVFFFNVTATTEIYTLSLHDALPICREEVVPERGHRGLGLGKVGEGLLRAERSEEHTSELQSRFDLVCRLLLEKKKKIVYSCLLYKTKKKIHLINIK